MNVRIKFSVFVFFLSASSISWALTPLEVVNARMAAHNDHDLEKFMATYSDSIQIYDFPDTPLGSRGKDHIKNIFATLFKNNSVKTTVKSQMVNGKYVVNRESVIREGKITEYISIYEVENELIQSVRFIK